MSTIRRVIDLNADLGESVERWESGHDLSLLRHLTSANVCCGAYAGDDDLLVATCAAAAARGVAIGAQVGYPDREGFGRRSIAISPAALEATVAEQIAHLGAIAMSVGTRVRYVKPHGALYNDIVHDQVRAAAVVRAVAASEITTLLGLPSAASLRLGVRHGLTVVREGFADRGYLADGTLVPRTAPGALLESPDAVAAQAVRLLTTDVATICIHSDTPGALAAAEATRAALTSAGATVEAFAR